MAKYFKFDSGLVLLYKTNKINTSTSIDISFDCGSRCDGKIPGLSHFCEHMFFTGTNKLSKQESMKRYSDFVKANAYTSCYDIVFTGYIMTNKLVDYLVAVKEMICDSTFTPQAVEEEKKVVIQEIAQYADKYARHVGDLKAYNLYGLEYFKNGILGSKESINSITSKDVKNYVKKYFVKNNCIISICTPLKFSKVKSLIKKYFESTMPSNNLKPLPYKMNKLIMQEKVSMYSKDIDKNFLTITFMLPQKGADIKYKAKLGMICDIIDDIGQGLAKKLRIDNSLIYYIYSQEMLNYQNSYIDISTEVGSENLKPCIDVIFEYIKGIRQNGFTYQQYKTELERDEYYYHTNVNSPDSVKDGLLKHRFYGKFISNEQLHKIIQSISFDELNQTVKEIFDNAKIQVLVYGNADKKDMYTIKQIQKKF